MTLSALVDRAPEIQTYTNRNWRVGFGAFVSISLHVAVAASLLYFGQQEASNKKSSNSALKTISVVSLHLSPQPTFGVAKPARFDTISTAPVKAVNAAGPIASPHAAEAVALPSLPKNIQEQPIASIEGAEIGPKLLGGIVINDDLMPPNMASLRAKIWIDEAGQATLVELLDDLKDPDASATITSALMDALYIPAQRGGKTVASIAMMQFSRSEVEFTLPLTEHSSVVTPFDSPAK